MSEIETSKWRALLTPQQSFRCEHCASQFEDHIDNRAYTIQTPIAIVIIHSRDAISFRNTSFSYVNPLIETRCDVCNEINTYPLNYWEENKIQERNERRGFQSSEQSTVEDEA